MSRNLNPRRFALTRCRQRRIRSNRRPLFARRAHQAGFISVEAAIPVVARCSRKRVAVNRTVDAKRPRRVLHLVAQTLRALRRHSHRRAQWIERRRIRATHRLCIRRQCGLHLRQRVQCLLLSLQRRLPGARRNYKPQEAPKRSKQYRQKNNPAHHTLAPARRRLRLGIFREQYRQIGAAMRTNLCRLIDFFFALPARIHEWEKPSRRTELIQTIVDLLGPQSRASESCAGQSPTAPSSTAAFQSTPLDSTTRKNSRGSSETYAMPLPAPW
jgi:hypothetical protein